MELSSGSSLSSSVTERLHKQQTLTQCCKSSATTEIARVGGHYAI